MINLNYQESFKKLVTKKDLNKLEKDIIHDCTLVFSKDTKSYIPKCVKTKYKKKRPC